MSMVANIVRKFAEYLSIWLLMNQFHLIKGWDFLDVLLLFNINQFAISLAGLFFWSPMMDLERLVRDGQLDGMLVRPINLFSHLIMRKFDVTFLGNLGLSVAVFIYYFLHTPTPWNLAMYGWFILTLIGAVLIYAAIHVFIGTFSFWIVRMNMVLATVLDFRRFLFFPITIYDRLVQLLLTFVIPLGFVNYYPLDFLLGKMEVSVVTPELLPVISFMLGATLFWLSYLFFQQGVNKYESTGS